MRVLLSNRQRPEKQEWITFPMGAPVIGYAGLERLRELARVPGSGCAASLVVQDLKSSIRNLRQYVPQDATPEQLNALAIRIGYMGPEEQVCFEGALDLNSASGMEDILRIADELEQYEMLLDVSSMVELGRYLVNSGVVEFPEAVCPYLDLEKIGIEYDANHGGVFKGASYITRREDAPELALRQL